MVNSPYYDNQYWEYHLPVNPPINPGVDVDVSGALYEYPWHVTEISVVNWDTPYFVPRLRDAVQFVSRWSEVTDYDPDLDEDSKDEYYDSAFD